MARLHVLRVFTAADESHGNPLGVFLEGSEMPGEQRQAVANELGFSETIFLDDRESGELRIFTPAVELPLAGHPLVGIAWLLREEGGELTTLRPPPGEVHVRFEAEMTFIAALPEWCPDFELVELGGSGEVDAFDGSAVRDEVYCWAWLDEEAGRVRARSFAPGVGVPEDEATGSAAIRLAAQLGRPIEIRQGRGSDLFARPADEGRVEVGGRVVLDEVREHPG